MYFLIKMNIWLTWMDNRLSFQNLDTDCFENIVPFEMADKIWKPKLIFSNHNERDTERQVLEYNPLSSTLMICRNGNGTKAGISELHEARVYTSNEAVFWLRTSHYTKFNCKFNLYYFPFDRQSCFVQLSVPGSVQKQIELSIGKPQRNMSLHLNQFILTNWSTYADQSDIYFQFEMTRLTGPFWMSLFIPSICLITAAEITLFIDGSHFDAMIMVALTSNLVMYTLYSAILEKMPEDSSLKLIDVWLVHGLLMPMIVFVILATSELMKSKSQDSHMMTMSTKIANSAIKAPAKNGGGKDEELSRNNMLTMLRLCKVTIPTISIIFILTFFMICLSP